jgi:hypothetical protein
MQTVTDVPVHRVSILTSQPKAVKTYAEMDMRKDDSDYLSLAHPVDEKMAIAKHIEEVFEKRPQYYIRRFSSDWPAYYSALEPETARSEMDHWICKTWQSDIAVGGSVTYSEFTVMLSGRIKDLRGLRDQYPELRADQYDRCHEAANLVRQEGADGLYSYSARCDNGTCNAIYSEFTLLPGKRLRSVMWKRETTDKFVMQ